MEQILPAFIRKYAEEVDNIEEMRREFKNMAIEFPPKILL